MTGYGSLGCSGADGPHAWRDRSSPLARDADEAADELRKRQQVYGFDSVTTHQPNLEALGEVIAAYRAADNS